MNSPKLLAILLLCLPLFACFENSEEVDPGVLGGPCHSDGSCNANLICGDQGLCLPDSAAACQEVDCGDHGFCAVADGAAVCVCEAGWTADGLSCVAESIGGPPTAMAGGVSNTDDDGEAGLLEGQVLITRAEDESSLSRYRLYWANDAGGLLGSPVAEYLATGSDIVHPLPAGTTVPVGATRFTVRTANPAGEMDAGVSAPILDADNWAPEAVVRRGVLVSGSNVEAVNGWYLPMDEERNGAPCYQHENELLWIYWSDDHFAWVLDFNLDPQDLSETYYYKEPSHHRATPFPTAGWSVGAQGAGHIQLRLFRLAGGAPYVDQTLSADYLYRDADGDPEGESQVAWYRCTDPEDPGQLVATTAGDYTVTEQDVGAYLRMQVTPVAAFGTPQGLPVLAEEVYGPIHPFRSLAVLNETYATHAELDYSPDMARFYLAWSQTSSSAVHVASYDGALSDLGSLAQEQDPDGAFRMALALGGGPWIALRTAPGGWPDQVQVHQLAGSSWVGYGQANDLARGNRVCDFSLALDFEDNPYLAYQPCDAAGPVFAVWSTGWGDEVIVPDQVCLDLSLLMHNYIIPTLLCRTASAVKLLSHNGATWTQDMVPFDSPAPARMTMEYYGQDLSMGGAHIEVARRSAGEWTSLGGPVLSEQDTLLDMFEDSGGSYSLGVEEEGRFSFYRSSADGVWEFLGMGPEADDLLSIAADGSGPLLILIRDMHLDGRAHLLETLD